MLNCPNRALRAPLLLPLLLLGLAAAGCGGADGARTFGGGGTGGAGSGTGGSPADAGTGGVTGSGGDIGGTGGSGGLTGSGGIIGSGGATGTGGRAGSGGAAGTGGRTGSGGAPGTGGRTGTGGTTGTGGISGTGGIAGTGGGGGANAAMCTNIETQYLNEMPNAKACVLASIVPQCQTAVAASLGCGSSCTTYVQNATTLHQIQNNWQAAGCASILRACPAIACINAQPGNCALTASATTAMCQNGPVLGTL